MMNTGNDRSPFSILIVDDEPTNIQLLGNILKTNGYDVEFATDGGTALDWLHNKGFDLVLLDIMMPGMNGYKVCEQMKADTRTAHIPVIFLTAKTETEDIVKAFDAGGADYVTKPFNPPELLARIKTHVEIKTLRGLIPICSNCRKVRDEKGLWEQLEAYVERHSGTKFSHSLCEKCADELYGDQDWYK
jgi:DNA-binding response OmpR family regulator